MEASPALQTYAESKLRLQIEKFASKPIEAHLTFSVDKHVHTVHLSLAGGDGFSMQVDHSCGDMYGSMDRVLDKLQAQLKKKKEILKDHHKQIRGVRLQTSTSEVEEVEIDASDIIKYERARRRA
jgi:putative sigma-54 modulation protein